MTLVGFTGTRGGMTTQQRDAVADILRDALDKLTPPPLRGLHGDCVGADHDFHRLCRTMEIPVYMRPCTATTLRAYTDATPVGWPIPPMHRNQLIVNDADIVLACPPTIEEQPRGGTWATIRMARKASKPLYVVAPDGTLVA